MLAAAEAAGIVHRLGTEFRYATGQAVATRALRDGLIGDPRLATFVLLQPGLADPAGEVPPWPNSIAWKPRSKQRMSGWSMLIRLPTQRYFRKAVHGILVPMCRANRGCSCHTQAAWGLTGTSVTISPAMVMRDFRCVKRLEPPLSDQAASDLTNCLRRRRSIRGCRRRTSAAFNGLTCGV